MIAEAPGLGVYVHWPYCAKICPYCDFNVVRDRGRSRTAAGLIAAILADLVAQAGRLGPRRLASVFFGGGTPSLMPAEWVATIMETAQRLWPPQAGLEVTLEANPTDAETLGFAALADAGVNRLSLGVQSLDDRQLQFLGRNHDAAAARRAAERARAAFSRVSFDLIYALPGQSTGEWTNMLTDAASLGPEHISAYQLTIEPGTAFDGAVRRGAIIPPAGDLAADLFETTQSVLGKRGFEAYEVSNHATSEAARSRHNLIYWRGDDYVGVGPGAHGRVTIGGERYATESPRAVDDYIGLVEQAGVGIRLEKLGSRDQALERLLMGLRTIEGVEKADLEPLGLNPERLAALDGLVQSSGGRLVATSRGRPVLDRIIAELAHGA